MFQFIFIFIFIFFLLFFFIFFYCYAITVVCLFSPSLYPTPGEPTSLPPLHPPPWFCLCVLNHLNPSLYLHPSSEVSVLFHQYTSTPRMISTDLVIQQPWGSIILCVELPQLCGYKREDILLFCNRKSLSRAKNLEL